jgi:hypothetical protein
MTGGPLAAVCARYWLVAIYVLILAVAFAMTWKS